MKEKTINQ